MRKLNLILVSLLVSSLAVAGPTKKYPDGISTTILHSDNLTLDGNTLSSSNTNGNVVINPNGTGVFNLPDLSTGLLHIDGSGNTSSSLLVNADVSGSAAIAYSKLSLSNSLLNGDIASNAAVSRSKLATGSTNRLVINDGSTGAMTEASAITANRALVSDANGIPTHTSVTNTELGYLSGATSNLQAQINSVGGSVTDVEGVNNVGLKASISSNTLVLELKNSNLSNDCTVGSPCTISFRSSTQSSGGYDAVSIGAATSITLAAVDSIGATAAATEHLFIYLLNDSTPELCASISLIDDTQLQSASALTGSADTSASTLWCSSAHTTKPVRLLGSVRAVWSNPNWGSVASIDQKFTRKYTWGSQQIFTSSGTYTRPPGVKAARVTVIGGGGGSGGVDGQGAGTAAATSGGAGGGAAIKFITRGLGSSETVTIGAGGSGGTAGQNNGSAGGTSSFGSHCSATGGSGSTGNNGSSATAPTTTSGGVGGVGSGGDINLNGGGPGLGYRNGAGTEVARGGVGGANGLGWPGPEGTYGAGQGTAASNPGTGGAGSASPAVSTNYAGANGAAGLVIVDEFY